MSFVLRCLSTFVPVISKYRPKTQRYLQWWTVTQQWLRTNIKRKVNSTTRCNVQKRWRFDCFRLIKGSIFAQFNTACCISITLCLFQRPLILELDLRHDTTRVQSWSGSTDKCTFMTCSGRLYILKCYSRNRVDQRSITISPEAKVTAYVFIMMPRGWIDIFSNKCTRNVPHEFNRLFRLWLYLLEYTFWFIVVNYDTAAST